MTQPELFVAAAGYDDNTTARQKLRASQPQLSSMAKSKTILTEPQRSAPSTVSRWHKRGLVSVVSAHC